MTDQLPMSAENIRLHALSMAAATYRETFRLPRKDEELPELAEQVLADARKYAGWIGHGDRYAAAPSDEAAEARGYARTVAVLRDDERYRNWWSAAGAWQHKPTGRYWDADARGHLADYLETINRPLPTNEERTASR